MLSDQKNIACLIDLDNGSLSVCHNFISWTYHWIVIIELCDENVSGNSLNIQTCIFQKSISKITYDINLCTLFLMNGYKVECRYNAVQFITILHTALQWQHQNINQTSKLQQTLHTSPSRASYGVSIMMILKKIDRVIMAPHYIFFIGCYLDRFVSVW